MLPLPVFGLGFVGSFTARGFPLTRAMVITPAQLDRGSSSCPRGPHGFADRAGTSPRPPRSRTGSIPGAIRPFSVPRRTPKRTLHQTRSNADGSLARAGGGRRGYLGQGSPAAALLANYIWCSGGVQIVQRPSREEAGCRRPRGRALNALPPTINPRVQSLSHLRLQTIDLADTINRVNGKLPPSIDNNKFSVFEFC